MARIVSDSIDVPNATTRVQISTSPARVLSIIFKARSGNTGGVYVGDVSVAAAVGLELLPGEEISIPISDSVQETGKPHTVPLSDFYVDAATNGNDVDFLAVTE